MQEYQQQKKIMEQHKISRRGFLGAGILVAASTIIIPNEPAIAAVNKFISPERSLSFYNTHTGEKLKAVYSANGDYLPDALADINYLLRDYRTGDIKKIDTLLLDLLYALKKKLKAREPFQVISGYRSPKTNAMLARRSSGVAKNSQHLYGKAVDIRLPECSLDYLHRAAVSLKAGGVGYYPKSNFVHVDVGRVRYW